MNLRPDSAMHGIGEYDGMGLPRKKRWRVTLPGVKAVNVEQVRQCLEIIYGKATAQAAGIEPETDTGEQKS